MLSSIVRAAPEADPILGITGSFGRYQLILCIVIFTCKFFIAFHQIAIVFLNPKISYTCGEGGEAQLCPCSNPVFDRSLFTRTMTTEWNLICERSFMASTQQSVFQGGTLIGSIIFGMAADRFGRKKPLLAAVLIQISCGIAASFIPIYGIFLLLRFLVGISVAGTMVTSFVIVMEFVGPEHREVLSAIYQVPFNIGHILLAVIAYFIRDFLTYQFAISAPALVMLCYYWAPETPRWLIAMNRLEPACKILEQAATVNKRPTAHIKGTVDTVYAKMQKGGQVKKGTVFDLFRTPNIRRNLICISTNWMACSYCFYGVSQYVGQLTGNVFLNVGVSATMALAGTLTSIPLMSFVGRRKILILCNGISALCLFLLGLLPSSITGGTLSVCLATVGLVSAFIVFVVVYLYTSELFPTVVRNAAMGLASSMARVGAMIAPFVIDLKMVAEWLPPFVFGLLPMVACLVTFLMPETKGCRLMNTIEEAENFRGTDRSSGTPSTSK